MLSCYNAYALPILFLYILFATVVMSSNKFSCILYEQTLYGKLKQGSRGINPYSSTSTMKYCVRSYSSLALSRLRNIRASSRLSNCLTSSALNIIARHDNEHATPIYMDTINYIATDVDTCPTKYGMNIQPSKNPTQQISRAIARYDAAIRAALHDNNAALWGKN